MLRRGPAPTRAIIAGLSLAASLPPWGWWPLGFVGIALWIELLVDTSRRSRARRSALVAVVWLAPATLWMFDLTPPGWPFAVLIQGAIITAACALIPANERRYVAFPAAIVLAEIVRWNWPFGGAPIATLAMAQVASPLAPTARMFGSLFLTALTLAVGVALAAADQRRWQPAGIAAGVVIAAVALTPLSPRGDLVDTIDVAIVQGGGPQNTRADLCENREVFERHMAASELIVTPVDLVLWPEDVVHPSSDSATTPQRCDSPLLGHTEARDRLAQLAIDLDAVLIAGFFERSPDGNGNVNYSVVYTADGGVGDRYDKVRLVPFGEFVPLRGLIEGFSGELPASDVIPGTEPAVLESPLGPLGVSISWEVFFDHRARDAIGNGGQILLNPTNGSSYWLTILQTQQVASSRLRALETDRWVLQAAPTGFSAIVTPDGDVVERSSISEARVIHGTVGLRDGQTLAVRWGNWPMLLFALLALAATTGRDFVRSRQSSAQRGPD